MEVRGILRPRVRGELAADRYVVRGCRPCSAVVQIACAPGALRRLRPWHHLHARVLPSLSSHRYEDGFQRRCRIRTLTK